MTQNTDSKPNFISVDLEQWRRDIDTFAAATNSALDAIISELSTACSGGQVRPSSEQVPATKTISSSSPVSNPVSKETSARSSVPTKLTGSKSSNANAGSRLASLKEKLASRMNKT